MADFTGKIALITGASRGFGAAAARFLASQGAHVILTARTTGGLEEQDDHIRAAGGSATLAPLDLMQLDQIDQLVASIYHRFGKLDFLIGNAAELGILSPVGHISPQQWEKTFRLNLHANQRLIRASDALLRQSPQGRALFVTCQQASADLPFWSVYGASKAALEAMVRSYAHEVEKTNLRVNLVDPGRMSTALFARAFPGIDLATINKPDAVVAGIAPLLAQDCTQHGQVTRLY